MEALLVFLARTAVHSAVATTVVEVLIPGWDVGDPRVRARLRAVALVVPAATAVLAPLAARAGAPVLLHVAPWLGVSVTLPLAVAVFALMAVVLVMQELWPWWLTRRSDERLDPLEPGSRPRLDAALASLPGARPPCYELRSGGLALGVRRVRGRDALVLGDAVIERLDDQELRAVLAHEAAHLGRGDLSHRHWMFALRVLLFGSPLALVTYRRLVNDSEEACDDAAVRATGTPLALAAGLLKAHGSLRPTTPGAGVLARAARGVARHARSVRLRVRVRRLLDGEKGQPLGNAWVTLTALGLSALLLGVA